MMTAQQAVRVYLAFYALQMFGISLVFTTQVPFLQQIGLNASDVSLVNLAFWGAGTLVDVPSGIFADRYGRLLATRIGIVVAAIGMALHAWANSLATIIACEIVLSVGSCFINGALRAWLKHTLDQSGENERFSGTILHESIYRNIATLIGGLVGGRIGFYNLGLPWLVSGACLGVCAVIACRLMQADSISHDQAPRSSDVRIAVDMLLQSRPLQWIALSSTLYCFVFTPLNNYWAPYFRIRISEAGGVWMWAVINVPILLAAWWIKRSGVEKPHQTIVMSASLLIACMFMLILPWTSAVPTMVGTMFINELARGVFMPLQDVYVQQQITNEERRASYSSLHSTIMRAGFFLAQSGIWLLTRGEPVSVAVIDRLLVIFGVLGCAAAALLFLRRPTE